MPKIWADTIAAHRLDVRAAILDAAGALVADEGPLKISMSQLAELAGIGRATLYKYFPDVEAVLAAWHGEHVAAHLADLERLATGPGSPADRLTAALDRYARVCRERATHGLDVGALVHRREQVAHAEHALLDIFRRLLTEARDAGAARVDVPADELAAYCLHALSAAAGLTSDAAVRRLVAVVRAGVEPGAPAAR